MNLLTAMFRVTYAYSSDLLRVLLREAFDVALDRGLALLSSHRPTRSVARDDYIRRSYLAGRVGHGYPDGTPATFGGVDATAYLHEIKTSDDGIATHSHPWEWAVSIVLAGGYTEEIVLPTGEVVIRQRRPGSIGLLSSSTFHRISELAAPRTWTLFLVGPRTPDGAWYFRRPNGSIVLQAEYHANLDAERRSEQAWLEEQSAAIELVSSTTTIETSPSNGALLEWTNDTSGLVTIKTKPFDSPEAARAYAVEQGLVGFRVVEPLVDQVATPWSSEPMIAREPSSMTFGTQRGDLVRVTAAVDAPTFVIPNAEVGFEGRVATSPNGFWGRGEHGIKHWMVGTPGTSSWGWARAVEPVPEPIESRRAQAERDPLDPRRAELGIKRKGGVKRPR